MRKSIITIILILIYACSFGQNENEINRMLEESIIKSRDNYLHLFKNLPIQHPFFLCQDGLPPKEVKCNESFYESIGLRTVSKGTITKLKDDLEQGIDILDVHYYLKGNCIEIYIHYLTATMNGDEVLLGYWPHCMDYYIYEYSCETNEWRLKEE